MKNLRIVLIYTLLLILSTIACKKQDPTTIKTTTTSEEKISGNTISENSSDTSNLSKEIDFDPDYDVYVGGMYHNGQNQQACYWKNGVLNPVELENNNSFAYDISVDGQDVYLVGQMLNKPCIWKNGKRQDLNDSGWLGYATKTIVEKNLIYTIGRIKPNQQTYYTPVLWIIDQNLQIQEILLENSAILNQSANSLGFIGTDLYITGMYQQNPCYWKWSNGVLEKQFIATHFGSATGVEEYNGNTYFFGSYDVNSNNNYEWGYWLNGQFELLNLSSQLPDYTLFKSTFSPNGKIYSVGHSFFPNNAATYANFWDDIGSVGQPLAAEESETSDIELNGNDIYISGTWFNISCVWKNGVMYLTNKPYSHGRGVEVVHK